ncbi:MAG: hypothetical protein ACYDDF_02155 [Thermoplasmatota archaeon]
MVFASDDTIILLLSAVAIALTLGLLLVVRHYREKLDDLEHQLRLRADYVPRGAGAAMIPAAPSALTAGGPSPFGASTAVVPVAAAPGSPGSARAITTTRPVAPSVAQVAALAPGFPFDARHFRYVGSPIAGIQFESDRIIFVGLSNREDEPAVRDVRSMVETGKVAWYSLPVPDA